jgi:hypothetical protein|tara:strand:+ start:2589 stop:2714 length:126 start_codon:yes stop_codon:yes gene_type:complete
MTDDHQAKLLTRAVEALEKIAESAQKIAKALEKSEDKSWAG